MGAINQQPLLASGLQRGRGVVEGRSGSVVARATQPPTTAAAVTMETSRWHHGSRMADALKVQAVMLVAVRLLVVLVVVAG
jgi:hypothetical protein